MSRVHARSSFLSVALLCLVFAMGAADLAAAADAPQDADRPTIYKWVDAHGIAHYTTDESRIPRAVRKRLRSLGATPDVAAASPSSPPAPVVGPLPDRPGRAEAWINRDAPPTPTEKQVEEREAEERSAELDAMDLKIAGLEEAIADREEQLLAFLAAGNGDTLNKDGFFRALVREIPAMQADLESLRERRGELATTP